MVKCCNVLQAGYELNKVLPHELDRVLPHELNRVLPHELSFHINLIVLPHELKNET